MPEHKDLTGADLHEPKGIASATAGQILVADGAGSGAWTDSPINIHGEMIIVANGTSTPTAAAVDPTLATDSDYVQISAGWADGHLDGVTRDGDELVATIAGEYWMTFWATLLVPKANNHCGIKFGFNESTPYSSRKIIHSSGGTNNYFTLAATGHIGSVGVGDSVGIYLASTLADSIVVQEATCMIQLLDPA
jgi:hypothetical protein